jgi:pyruvate carboxylase
VFCIDGDLSKLPTNHFLQAMEIGQTLAVDLEPGKTLYVEMTGISAPDDSNEVKVSFKLNGEARFVLVEDKSSGSAKMGGQEKADPNIAGHVGAPMPGVVVGVNVEVGQRVEAGDSLVTLSAMKMETVVTAVKSGVVKRVQASAGDSLAAGDLLLVIDDSAEDEDEDEDEE